MTPKPPNIRPADRKEILNEIRQTKMARSAHAYVRGSTLKFYEWLESGVSARMPQGPPVWICGDCHVGNLGPVANAEGEVEIQVRDLDQTVIGNPAHDVIRLGLSLATAVRSSNLSGVITARMLEQLVEGYEHGLSHEGSLRRDLQRAKVIKAILSRALKRRWRHLARERIEDPKPTIPLGKRFWKISKQERDDLRTLIQAEEVRQLITSLHMRRDDADIDMLDAAYWVKGCSSLGRLRYAVIVKVGNGGGFSLIDIKEAAMATAPRDRQAAMPRENGKRIVNGARNLSPHIGERTFTTRFRNCGVIVRELLPQDLRLELDCLTDQEVTTATRYLASVLGGAHGRQMDRKNQDEWNAELKRHRPKSLDAPSWLWTSVVELIAIHENAYLEHCRTCN